MKTETLFVSIFLSLLTCLPVALAAPIPGYPNLPEPPPPGQSGVFHDKPAKEVKAYYGEKDMEKHMEHLMYNQRKHPENDRSFQAGPPRSRANRLRALEGTKALKDYARDEKPPNSAVHDGTKVTLRYLPEKESKREMRLLSTTTTIARHAYVPTRMRYIPNPGPNYHGRGARSISRQTDSGVGTETSSKKSSGSGRPRPDSAGPYRKGHAPEPKSTPNEAREPRGRWTTKKPIGGSSKPKDDKGKAAMPKVPWNAGPGLQQPRRSSRLATNAQAGPSKQATDQPKAGSSKAATDPKPKAQTKKPQTDSKTEPKAKTEPKPKPPPSGSGKGKKRA